MSSIHWLHAVDGDFNTPADWRGGSIPGPSDAAILDAKGASFTVTASYSESVRSIQLSANATLDITGGTFAAAAGTGVGANAGTISVGPGGTLAVAGAVTNTGTIALHGATQKGASHVASLDIGAAGVTLGGGGTIVLSEAVPAGAQIYGVVGSTMVNVDNTITGAGVIGSGALALVNEAGGVIDADVNAADLDVRGGTVANAGLLEATGGGRLLIFSGTADYGTINNRGGVIEAGAGGYAQIGYDDIVGGTLVGTGLLRASHVVLDGTASPVDISGQLNTSGHVTLRGAIVNTGVIAQDEAGLGFLAFGIDVSTTLSGGGAVGGVAAYAAGVTLYNVDNRLGGPLSGDMNVVNEAKGVIGGVGDSDRIDLQGQTLANEGLVEASRGAALLIEQTTIANGATGILLAAPGARMAMAGVDITGGTLEASDASIAFTRYVNTLDGVANAVTVEGSVAINNGVSLVAQGLIVDRGSITLRGDSLAAHLIVGAPGVTLTGRGDLTLTDSDLNVIEGASAGATLTNVNDTIAGAGLLGDGQMTLANRVGGLIESTGSNTLVVDTGTNAILNAGTIEAIGPGGLTIQSLVRNSGRLTVATGTLLVDGVVSGKGSAAISGGVLDFARFFNEAVTFTGSEGVLELARSQIYGGSISGFSKTGGTSLDLRDIAFVSPGEATFSGTATSGVLTVSDGTHAAHISLVGDYLASAFVCASDGDGGVIVNDPAPPAPAAPTCASASSRAFVQAMAGLGASGRAGGLFAAQGWREAGLTLIAPRIQTA
jgi:hypothetical protein